MGPFLFKQGTVCILKISQFILLIVIFSVSIRSVSATPVNPTSVNEADHLQYIQAAKCVVIAEYLGFEFFPKGIQNDSYIQAGYPWLYVPVRALYKPEKVLKGTSLPTHISVKSEYSFKCSSHQEKDWIPCGVPKPGTKWILFLRNTDEKLLKEDGFVPLFSNYSFGIQSSDKNLKLVLDAITKSKSIK